MNKNKQFLKLFVVLFFGTAFIFSFSHYGAKAFGNIANVDGKFSNGTTIGSLDVSGKTEEEAGSLLEQHYIEWIKEASIKLEYGEKIALVDLNKFHLDANKTIESIKDGENNAAYITIDTAKTAEQVSNLFPQLKSNELNLDKLTAALNETASLFDMEPHSFNLYKDYLLLGKSNEEVVLSTAVIDLNEIPFDLQTFIDKNPVIKMKEETTFSLLELTKKLDINDSDALGALATGIYQTALPTNFTIVERNISSSLPEYASLGFEASVNPAKSTDLVIANPNKEPYSFEFQLNNSQLKVTLKGERLAYSYKISTKDEQKLKPKVIVQYSPLLLPGKTKVQTRGTEGLIVKVYRDVYQGDSFIKSELISEDYYPANYQVEIHGLGGNVQGQVLTQTQTTTESNTQAATPSDSNGKTTTATGDTSQQDSTESDIWGNPNEQPK